MVLKPRFNSLYKTHKTVLSLDYCHNSLPNRYSVGTNPAGTGHPPAAINAKSGETACGPDRSVLERPGHPTTAGVGGPGGTAANTGTALAAKKAMVAPTVANFLIII